MAHVLVLDDDADMRAARRLVLTEEGHEVAKAADGQAALELLRTTSLRWVVLLDDRMPGVNGVAVLEVVATTLFLVSQHAYIAIPATVRPDAPIEALGSALAVPLIPKPFDLEDLFAGIAQAEARLSG